MLPAATFDNLQARSFEELHPYFREGTAPSLDEMTGDARGVFLAWNPEASWLMKVFVRWMFRRWLGKRFFPVQTADPSGHGINLFSDDPTTRYAFQTYLGTARMDGAACLILDYNVQGSLRGLVDDVKKVAEGLVLGQINYKFFWQHAPTFYLYFTLERKGQRLASEIAAT
ncbi:MAG TPA: hypothetical protein VIX19_07225 [Terriglobales bacterium]